MPEDETARRGLLETMSFVDLQMLSGGGDHLAGQIIVERRREPRNLGLARVLRAVAAAVDRLPRERWESAATYEFLRFACYEVCDGGADPEAMEAIDSYFFDNVCPRCESEQLALDDQPDLAGESIYKCGHKE